MRVLVTGGAGYIGSHTAKLLHEAGAAVLTYDNLSRGHAHAVRWGDLVVGELADTDLLIRTITEFRPDAIVHFAAFAYVGESVEQPGEYYRNNVGGTLSLLNAMRDTGVKALVVSSTCASYGEPEQMPITEATPQLPINPYGHSKVMMEQMCRDYDRAHGIKTVALRYFNAAGCDPDGEIGEEHYPEPHLIPRALMAASGEIGALTVFGSDYPTPDGTCVRDYIHVNDLGDAHIRAVRYLLEGGASDAFNLGTGTGYSVQQIIEAVGAVTGQQVPYTMAERRPGDPPVLVSNAERAGAVLGWKPGMSDLASIIRTAWGWHKRNTA